MLRTRIVTALILAVALLLVLFAAPPIAGVAFFGVALLIGAWEWARFAGLHAPAARLAYVAACALLGAMSWRATRDTAQLLNLMVVAAAWWIVALLWLSLRPTAVSKVAAGVAGMLVLVPTWIAISRLLGGAPAPGGAALLMCLLLLVWAADIGAYFVGRRFGRLKLAPQVSPNKTWEGVLGGTALALVVGLLELRWLGCPSVPYVGLTLVIVCVSIIGDLTESMFKRVAGLKDSGELLPGHGGVLDRIDSITAAAPFFVLGLTWLGVLR
jgi:phosphatidate cytidylyltransferase